MRRMDFVFAIYTIPDLDYAQIVAKNALARSVQPIVYYENDTFVIRIPYPKKEAVEATNPRRRDWTAGRSRTFKRALSSYAKKKKR